MSPSEQSTSPEHSQRPYFAVALALALAGMAVSGWLVRLHFRAHEGYVSFCALGEGWNCDTVALSSYSVLLGIPVAAWGVLGFGIMATLAGLGLPRTEQERSWPSGLLFLVAAFSVLGCLSLALVSEFLIQSFCVMCAVSWTLVLLIFAVALLACRREGVRHAIMTDLRILQARPIRLAVLAVLLLAVVATARAAYPRYWEKPRAPAAQVPAASQTTPAQPAALRAPGTEIVVQEFSDFECPFCAKAYEEMKATAAAKPDLRVVARNFPLDSACNPAVTHTLHERACEYARASICAESLGKGDEMNSMLFADQKAHRGLDEIVKDLGLDRTRFGACMASKDTAERLSADVKEGIRLGLRATPSFVVKGQVYTGRIPDEVLK